MTIGLDLSCSGFIGSKFGCLLTLLLCFQRSPSLFCVSMGHASVNQSFTIDLAGYGLQLDLRIAKLRASTAFLLLGVQSCWFVVVVMTSWSSSVKGTHDLYRNYFHSSPLTSDSVVWCGTQIRGTGKLPSAWSSAGIKSASHLWMVLLASVFLKFLPFFKA